jgi:hypothetical protein
MEFFAGVTQGSLGQGPERLVGRTPAHGDEAGVLNLFVAPQEADGLPLAWEQLFGQHPHAVHIEQRAVGVKQDGLGGVKKAGFLHPDTVFDTEAAINTKKQR